MTDQNTSPDYFGITSKIVAAYVTTNQVSATELPTLIQQVHQCLIGLKSVAENEPPPQTQTPAVPVKRSYTEDAITCLECGRKFKLLKRHLGIDHGLSPDQYRAKWKLSDEYPLVTSSHSRRRSEIAKKLGLGRGQAAVRVMETESPATSVPDAGLL